MSGSPQVATVVGARPQFIKLAMLTRRLAALTPVPFRHTLIHTGQHYDADMSEVFFRELELPRPRYELGVGSDRAAQQIAAIMSRLEPLLTADRPDALLVLGDTHSTLAAALVAAHLEIPLVHIEAGERIYRRRRVPEESNRVVADHLATLCLTASRPATWFLEREGIAGRRVRFAGDLHYDLFLWAVGRPELRRVTSAALGLAPGGFILATLHRPENTDAPERLAGLLRQLDEAPLPVVLPMHPRLRGRLADQAFTPKRALRLIDPVGYFDLLGLLLDCRRVVSDSGGVIREAYFARRPCVVPMADNWWRQIAWLGWSIEVGDDEAKLRDALADFDPPATYPEGLFGDGNAAATIIDATAELIGSGAEPIWTPRGRPTSAPRAGAPGERTDFTWAGYRRLIEGLRAEGYDLAPFPEAAARLSAARPFALLRHDVDMDLEAAVELARLEHGWGVQSTYFIMVRNPFYSPFSAEGSRAVRQILDCGHHLGLHLEAAAYPADHPLHEACAAEAGMLEAWFGRPVEIVSFHRPDARVLGGDPSLTAPRPHTYMALFRETIQYLSDSRGRWREGHPLRHEAFHRRRPLHLLVHPIWYGAEPTDPHETLERFLDRHAARSRQALEANCRP
ncbi:MAG TPA: UDP-N-acetylglucosamine 2-epimerase [Candidatus Sumerlaeota bacterium]|nr:UDP-N-acetylglucosamine 2-epimerase [Candidatus Sumerlaeota bacterium]